MAGQQFKAHKHFYASAGNGVLDRAMPYRKKYCTKSRSSTITIVVDKGAEGLYILSMEFR